jgi:hypothetical protein
MGLAFLLLLLLPLQIMSYREVVRLEESHMLALFLVIL